MRSGEFEPQSYAEFGIGQFMIESFKMFSCDFFEIESRQIEMRKRPHIVKIRRIEYVTLAYLIKVETKNLSV